MLVHRKLSPLAFHQYSVFSCNSCWTEAILGEEGLSIFARRCKPSGSDPLRKWTRSLNLEVLLLFYSGGVVVSPWKVGGFSSQYLATDVEYLQRISCDQSIHGDFTLEMAIRGSCITCEDIMVFL